ncbi:MAG: hypothetical protein ABI923_02575 [bacterium]
MVLLIPVDIGNIGGPNHILYNLPFSATLMEQSDNTIVERSRIDGVLTFRKLVKSSYVTLNRW